MCMQDIMLSINSNVDQYLVTAVSGFWTIKPNARRIWLDWYDFNNDIRPEAQIKMRGQTNNFPIRGDRWIGGGTLDTADPLISATYTNLMTFFPRQGPLTYQSHPAIVMQELRIRDQAGGNTLWVTEVNLPGWADEFIQKLRGEFK